MILKIEILPRLPGTNELNSFFLEVKGTTCLTLSAPLPLLLMTWLLCGPGIVRPLSWQGALLLKWIDFDSIPKLQWFEVGEWISNFIPHFTGHEIIYPCCCEFSLKGNAEDHACKMSTFMFRLQCINSLPPSDAMWWQRYWLIMDQVWLDGTVPLP